LLTDNLLVQYFDAKYDLNTILIEYKSQHAWNFMVTQIISKKFFVPKNAIINTTKVNTAKDN
jgi:hypothetical protein